MTPALAGLMAAGCVLVGLLAVPALRDQGPLERFAEPGFDPAAPAGRSSLVGKLVARLSAALGPRSLGALSSRRRERIARRIDLAGRPQGLTVQSYVGRRAAYTVLGLVVAGFLVLLGTTPLTLVAGGLIGWYALDVGLARTGRLRQERIERDLPDFLDILAVTVRAGLGFRAALTRVAESLGGPAGEEIVLTLRQMDLGVSRRDAFLALRDRNASPQLAAFVAAQLQAEELGVPLSEALNDIAADMRRAAHQDARKRAAQAAPRVSLIVTSLIVPGSMIVIFTAMFLGADVGDVFD